MLEEERENVEVKSVRLYSVSGGTGEKKSQVFVKIAIEPEQGGTVALELESYSRSPAFS